MTPALPGVFSTQRGLPARAARKRIMRSRQVSTSAASPQAASSSSRELSKNTASRSSHTRRPCAASPAQSSCSHCVSSPAKSRECRPSMARSSDVPDLYMPPMKIGRFKGIRLLLAGMGPMTLSQASVGRHHRPFLDSRDVLQSEDRRAVPPERCVRPDVHTIECLPRQAGMPVEPDMSGHPAHGALGLLHQFAIVDQEKALAEQRSVSPYGLRIGEIGVLGRLETGIGAHAFDVDAYGFSG